MQFYSLLMTLSVQFTINSVAENWPRLMTVRRSWQPSLVVDCRCFALLLLEQCKILTEREILLRPVII